MNDTETHRQSAMEWQRQRSEWGIQEADNTQAHWLSQKLGERQGVDSPTQPSKGTTPANTCISDLTIPEIWENNFVLI